MDLNVLFTNPDCSSVTNQILRFLPYDSIKACCDVSPAWKKFIDQQKFWRLDHFSSLIKKKWTIQKTDNFEHYSKLRKVNFLEKFPEWEKLIPHVQNQMSVSDIEKLVNGLEHYFDKNETRLSDKTNSARSEWSHQKNEEYDKMCPLKFAVHDGNFEFVEVMIRTPFDFKSLKFKILTCEDGDDEYQRHRNCDLGDERYSGKEYRWDYCKHYEDGFNVLDKAANRGHNDIVNLLLEFPEENKIDKAGSAIYAARKNPQLLKVLMKHCNFNRKVLSHLGKDTLASLVMMGNEEPDEPPKKKFKEDEFDDFGKPRKSDDDGTDDDETDDDEADDDEADEDEADEDEADEDEAGEDEAIEDEDDEDEADEDEVGEDEADEDESAESSELDENP